jgi:hypothetical protein
MVALGEPHSIWERGTDESQRATLSADFRVVLWAALVTWQQELPKVMAREYCRLYVRIVSCQFQLSMKRNAGSLTGTGQSGKIAVVPENPLG